MANEYKLFIKSSVRGYHAYKDAKVYIGEMLECELDLDNEHDTYAVVKKNGAGRLLGMFQLNFHGHFTSLFLVMEKSKLSVLEIDSMLEEERAWKSQLIYITH